MNEGNKGGDTGGQRQKTGAKGDIMNEGNKGGDTGGLHKKLGQRVT